MAVSAHQWHIVGNSADKSWDAKCHSGLTLTAAWGRRGLSIDAGAPIYSTNMITPRSQATIHLQVPSRRARVSFGLPGRLTSLMKCPLSGQLLRFCSFWPMLSIIEIPSSATSATYCLDNVRYRLSTKENTVHSYGGQSKSSVLVTERILWVTVDSNLCVIADVGHAICHFQIRLFKLLLNERRCSWTLAQHHHTFPRSAQYTDI